MRETDQAPEATPSGETPALLTMEAAHEAVAKLAGQYSHSAELQQLDENIHATHRTGPEGVQALNAAIDYVDTLLGQRSDELASDVPEDQQETVTEFLGQLQMALVTERAIREPAVRRDQELEASRDLTHPSAPFGGDAQAPDAPSHATESRITAAQRQLERIYTSTTSERSKNESPAAAELARFYDQNFGYLSASESTIHQVFSAEVQHQATAWIQGHLQVQVDHLAPGETLPDTTLAILGDKPEFIQQYYAGATGRVITRNEALRLTFTSFANAVHLNLPPELTTHLRPDNPLAAPQAA